MIDGMNLHLVVYRTRYYITRSETQTRIIFLHELFPIRQTENTSVSAHGFGNEISRMCLLRVIQTRRMELHKLHIFDHSLCAIDHRDTIARSYLGVRRCRIDSTGSTGSHQRDTTEVRVDLLGLGVEDIGTVALDIRRTTGDTYTEMVLRDDLYGKMVLQHFDIRISPYGFHQSALYLRTRVVGVVQNTELRVTTFAV